MDPVHFSSTTMAHPQVRSKTMNDFPNEILRNILAPYTKQKCSVFSSDFDHTVFSLFRVCRRWSDIVVEDFLRRKRGLFSDLRYLYVQEMACLENTVVARLVRERRWSHWVEKETNSARYIELFGVKKKRVRTDEEQKVLDRDVKMWGNEVARAWRG